MSKQKQQTPASHADGLPTLLAMFNPVLLRQRKGVIKYQRRFLKVNAVLANIDGGLAFVPLKDSFHTEF